MPTLRLALEWFLNPDHLPLLAARETLEAAKTLEVELIVPDDHYDGFAELAAGRVDVVTNEPLHLMEHQQAELASLGTYFHTDGGVLITAKAAEKLLQGQPIRVSSPVSNAVTDGLCRDIIAGWLRTRGKMLATDQVEVYEGGFDHVDNLAAGADAAWLAFANIELIDALQRGLDVSMITTTDGGIPGFSALELITRRELEPEQASALKSFVSAVDAAIPVLAADPAKACALWYRASGETPSAATDATIRDTLTRFVAPVRPDAGRWRDVWHHMSARGADIVDEATFEAIFAGPHVSA